MSNGTPKYHRSVSGWIRKAISLEEKPADLTVSDIATDEIPPKTQELRDSAIAMLGYDPWSGRGPWLIARVMYNGQCGPAQAWCGEEARSMYNDPAVRARLQAKGYEVEFRDIDLPDVPRLGNWWAPVTPEHFKRLGLPMPTNVWSLQEVSRPADPGCMVDDNDNKLSPEEAKRRIDAKLARENPNWKPLRERTGWDVDQPVTEQDVNDELGRLGLDRASDPGDEDPDE